MTPRSKALLFTLIGLLVVWQVGSSVWSVVWGPVLERRKRAKSLEAAVEKQRDQKREVLVAMRRLKEWKVQSLPPEPLTAATLYQNWLITLLSEAGLKDATVLPSRIASQGPEYVAVPMTIRAETQLDTLCDLLVRFQQANLLQRLVRLSIDKQRSRNERLNVVLEVEGISLPTAPKRITLFADAARTKKPAGQRPELADYQELLARHIFEAGSGAAIATKPADEPQEETDFNPAEQIYLVASWALGEERDAWLYDRANNERHILLEGKAIELPGFTAVTRKIGSDHVILEQGSHWYRLDLGRNLGQLEEVKKSS